MTILNKEITLDDRFIPEQDVQHLVRICEDQLTPEDFFFLKDQLTTLPQPHSVIIPSPWLEENHFEETMHLREMTQYQQLTMVHFVNPETSLTFLVSLTTGDVDEYFIGDCPLPEVQAVEAVLASVCQKLSPPLRLQFRRRLHIPQSFNINSVLMASILAAILHYNGKYLDLTGEKVLHFKADLFQDFKLLHDNWLGKFNLEETTESSHPFIIETTSIKNWTSWMTWRIWDGNVWMLKEMGTVDTIA